MKNSLKKLVSLLTVFVMVLGLVPAFAATYTDLTEADAEAVQVLSAFGIIKGYEDGTFGGDRTITRAEFSAIACRFMGYGELSSASTDTIFPDVPAGHWASGSVMIAQQQGIVIGYPDGNFYPEVTLTYEQAVTMLMRALGYEPMAAEIGYPAGYLYAAAQANVTSGINGSIGADAKRSIVARLTHKALDAQIMERTLWGTGDKEYQILGTRASEKYLNSVKLTDVEVITNQYMPAGTEGKVSINGNYLSGSPLTSSPAGIEYLDEAGLADLTGYKATAYVSSTDVAASQRKVTVASIDLTGALVLDKAQITDETSHVVSYYTDMDSDDNEDDFEIKNSAATVYLNGVKATGTTTAAGAETLWAAADDARITFLNNEGGTAYDYDTIVIETFNAYTVKSNNGKTLTSESKGSYGDDNDDFESYDKKGNKYIGIEPADLVKGDVVTYQLKGTKYFVGEVNATKEVDGKVNKLLASATGRILVDDVPYVMISGLDGISKIARNVEGVFTVTPSGRIIKYTEREGSFGTYGVVDGDLSDGKYLYVYEDASGESVEYELASKVLVDGVSKTATQARALAEASTTGVVTFVTDGDLITEITIPTTSTPGYQELGATAFTSGAYYDASNGRLYYDGRNYVTVDSTTPVFMDITGLGLVTVDIKALADNQYFAHSGAYAFNVDTSAKTAGAIYVKTEQKLRYSDMDLFVLTGVREDKNDANEMVTVLEGFENGKLVSDGLYCKNILVTDNKASTATTGQKLLDAAAFDTGSSLKDGAPLVLGLLKDANGEVYDAIVMGTTDATLAASNTAVAFIPFTTAAAKFGAGSTANVSLSAGFGYFNDEVTALTPALANFATDDGTFVTGAMVTVNAANAYYNDDEEIKIDGNFYEYGNATVTIVKHSKTWGSKAMIDNKMSDIGAVNYAIARFLDGEMVELIVFIP